MASTDDNSLDQASLSGILYHTNCLVAYTAGFFEAEGCICISKSYGVRLTACQVYKEPSLRGTGCHSRERDHCSRGHVYTPETTYIRKPEGWRQCRICQRENQRRSYRARSGG